jgi:hypothetical protein
METRSASTSCRKKRSESCCTCSATSVTIGQRDSCCLRRRDARRLSVLFGPKSISKRGPGRSKRRDGKIPDRPHGAGGGRPLIMSCLYQDRPGRFWKRASPVTRPIFCSPGSRSQAFELAALERSIEEKNRDRVRDAACVAPDHGDVGRRSRLGSPRHLGPSWTPSDRRGVDCRLQSEPVHERDWRRAPTGW